jgi:hypothetical protein
VGSPDAVSPQKRSLARVDHYFDHIFFYVSFLLYRQWMGIVCSVDHDHRRRGFVDVVNRYYLVEWAGFAILITNSVAPRAVLSKCDDTQML